MKTFQPTRRTALLAAALACALATGCKGNDAPSSASPSAARPPALQAPVPPPPPTLPPAPPPPAESAPPAASTGKLVIVKATWGVLYGTSAKNRKDVTKQIRDLVGGDALTVIASSALLGDVAPGTYRDLKVEYKKGKLKGKRVVGEGETLTITIDDKPVPPRLIVTRALYGELSGDAFFDVTAKVADMVRGGTLSVSNLNSRFGDPAIGITKQLRVEYKVVGQTQIQTKAVEEGETLVISDE